MKRKLAEERLSMVAEKRQLLEEKRNAQEEIIKTDNGPQLNAAEFNAKYCTANSITHEKVTPRWAQANGEVARQNRSIEKRKNELQKYVTKYRGLHQTTTGKSLAELMLNRYVKGKLPDQGWWLCYKLLSSLWAVKTVGQIISDIILFTKGCCWHCLVWCN